MDERSPKRVTTGGIARAKSNDYVCLNFSTYPAELAATDAVVARLKAAGVRGMTRSRLIRIALARLDAEAVLVEEVAREKDRVR